jgi:hypothetical protein
MEVGERGVRVRAVGGSRAGEIRITRFLRNPKVSVEEIVSEARRKTLGTVSGHHILAIQDTTTLRDDGGGRGIVAHPVIAVDAGSGTLLGLVHAEFIFRDGGPRAPRKTRPLADKQSHRWLEGAAQAASLVVAGHRGLICLCGPRTTATWRLVGGCSIARKTLKRPDECAFPCPRLQGVAPVT